MKYLVGTASWTDKTLIDCGRFYPADCKTPEARLRFYASNFPLVEVDSSYYAIPAPATAQLWVERTPDDFVFNETAFRLFTGHATEAKVLPKDIQQALGAAGQRLYYKTVPEEIRAELWRRFAEALEPLRLAGKLGLVHFQFPPAVRYSKEAMAHIEKCLAWLPQHTFSIEFRHKSWWDGPERTASTLDFLREHAREQLAKRTGTGLALSIGAQLLGLGQVGDLAARGQLEPDQVGFGFVGAAELQRQQLRRAGFDPQASVTLWQKMGNASASGQSGGLSFLSTHPSGPDRIHNLQENIPKVEGLYRAAKR